MDEQTAARLAALEAKVDRILALMEAVQQGIAALASGGGVKALLAMARGR